MKLSFDHLVHIVNRPEEAIEDFATIGLKAIPGGKHRIGERIMHSVILI